MPRKKNNQPIKTQPKKAKTITVDIEVFRALHSAGRALFSSAISTENHSAESLVFLHLLDSAIEEGHKLLGTQRSYADRYIYAVKGITQVQAEHAKAFLEKIDKDT